MFIRKTRILNRETKKYYFNFQLVESLRTERGPRQRILLNLGADLNLDPQECKILANRIETIATGQYDLFVSSEKIEKLAQSYAARLIRNLSEPMEKLSSTAAVPEAYKVHIDTLKQKEARTVGAEHLLLYAAEELKLPRFLKKLDLSDTEIALSMATIISRAVFPASERATFMWLQQQSGLGELLNFDFCNISLQKLYDSSDLLLKHKEALEIYLEREQRVIHGVTSTMILYDLTNMYMEGQAKENPKARHGRSKEKRSDCPLITLGLVVDEHGFPFRSKILAGNVGETTTMEKAIQELGCGLDLFKPTIILDAGIATEENLEWLRKNGFYYIVSARQTSPSLEVEGEYMCAGSDEQVKVANIKIEGDGDKWLICHSPGKEATSSQMKTLFQQRFEQDLLNLQESLSKPRGRKKYEKVVERVGRLKEKHKRIAGCYEIEVIPSPDKPLASAVKWKILGEKLNERLTGEYFLRTNRQDKNAKELWEIYNTLRKIEDAFRFMKSSLGMRPIYHQKEKRVDGHLWITILAYYLIQDITYRLRKMGVKDQWSTVRTSMSSRLRVTAQVQTEEKKTLHIRSTTEPEQNHTRIYTALNISPKILPTMKTIR
jgi:transposase